MYCEEDEFYDEEYYEDGLTEEEIEEIHEEYRRKRLMESLIGPSVSSIFHVLLVVILAIFITDKVKEPIAEIEVTIEDIEEVDIPDPPKPEPIIEPEKTDLVQPNLTTVAVDNPKADDISLEEIDDATPSTDDKATEDAVSDVVISVSATASPSLKAGRTAAGRASALNKFGGTKKGQDQLMKGLWWLAKVQNPDGSWGTAAKPAYTGLALLTFLAHGETTTSKFFGGTVKHFL